MDDLVERLATFRDEVAPPWDDARRDRAYLGVGRLRRRRKLQRAALTSAGALTAVGVVCGWFAWAPLQQAPIASSSGSERSHTQPQTRPEAESVALPIDEAVAAGSRARLADGSQVEVAAASTLYVRANAPQQIRLDLLAGSARFDVVPNRQREFVVSVDGLEVVVVGTAFEVARAGARVRVAVSHGRVRVGHDDRWEQVAAGESNWFEVPPRIDTHNEPVSRPAPRSAARGRNRAAPPSPETASRPAPEDRADWRSVSRSGDYDRAYELLAQRPELVSRAEDLVAAADVARWSNHPEMAAKYLRKLLELHRDSPQAALAAFTLGRILLDSLGRPSQAAEAFATVQDLNAQDAVAEDALAREVEAWSKAGHAEEAYRRARFFQQRYAQSRRLRVVEFYGGLRDP